MTINVSTKLACEMLTTCHCHYYCTSCFIVTDRYDLLSRGSPIRRHLVVKFKVRHTATSAYLNCHIQTCDSSGTPLPSSTGNDPGVVESMIGLHAIAVLSDLSLIRPSCCAVCTLALLGSANDVHVSFLCWFNLPVELTSTNMRHLLSRTHFLELYSKDPHC